MTSDYMKDAGQKLGAGIAAGMSCHRQFGMGKNAPFQDYLTMSHDEARKLQAWLIAWEASQWPDSLGYFYSQMVNHARIEAAITHREDVRFVGFTATMIRSKRDQMWRENAAKVRASDLSWLAGRVQSVLDRR